MKNGKLAVLILVFTLSVFGKTLEVGVALRFTDGYNGSVGALKRGFDTAKDYFEKHHPSTRIKLTEFPHQADLASVQKTAQVITQSNVSAVLGGEMSEESVVLGDELNAAKTVFITPTSSNPKVTEQKPFVFRGCFSDGQVAERMARYVRDVLKAKKIGVIRNVSSPYTDYLSSHFVKTIQEDATTTPEVLVEKVLRRTLDFSSQIEMFKLKKVTHLILFTHDNDLLTFVPQAHSRSFFPMYIGSDGWGSSQSVFHKFFEMEPKAAQFKGVRNSYWQEGNNRSITKQFRKMYQTKFQAEPDAWAAIAFDSALVLFTAMDRASDPKKGESIRQELKKIKDIALTTSPSFTFDELNSPKKDLYLYRISHSGIQYEVTLK